MFAKWMKLCKERKKQVGAMRVSLFLAEISRDLSRKRELNDTNRRYTRTYFRIQGKHGSG